MGKDAKMQSHFLDVLCLGTPLQLSPDGHITLDPFNDSRGAVYHRGDVVEPVQWLRRCVQIKQSHGLLSSSAFGGTNHRREHLAHAGLAIKGVLEELVQPLHVCRPLASKSSGKRRLQIADVPIVWLPERTGGAWQEAWRRWQAWVNLCRNSVGDPGSPTGDCAPQVFVCLGSDVEKPRRCRPEHAADGATPPRHDRPLHRWDDQVHKILGRDAGLDGRTRCARGQVVQDALVEVVTLDDLPEYEILHAELEEMLLPEGLVVLEFLCVQRQNIKLPLERVPQEELHLCCQIHHSRWIVHAFHETDYAIPDLQRGFAAQQLLPAAPEDAECQANQEAPRGLSPARLLSRLRRGALRQWFLDIRKQRIPEAEHRGIRQGEGEEPKEGTVEDGRQLEADGLQVHPKIFLVPGYAQLEMPNILHGSKAAAHGGLVFHLRELHGAARG
mmetsp:Transcript_54384/g.142121  ORF Transcript_54384/g.142121 Transcript_54384/m.142121 type:complete len:443 (-) Transcript_54384:5942-7270(-)